MANITYFFYLHATFVLSNKSNYSRVKTKQSEFNHCGYSDF